MLIHRSQIKMEPELQLGLSVDIISKSRSTVATPFQIIAWFNWKFCRNDTKDRESAKLTLPSIQIFPVPFQEW